MAVSQEAFCHHLKILEKTYERKMKFDLSVETILKANGWTENRSVDPSPWIQTLNDNGFDVTPDVEAFFLKCFGGLQFTPPINPKGKYRPEELSFSPADPVCEFERVSYWAKKLNEVLCPVGAVFRRATLCIGESGTYYLISDVGVSLAGETLFDCMKCLIEASTKPTEVLPAPERE